MRGISINRVKLPLVIFSSIFLFATLNCSYRVVQTNELGPKQSQKLARSDEKTLFIHQNNHIYLIRFPEFTKTHITGVPIHADTAQMILTPSMPKNKVIANSEALHKHLSSEIHIFVNDQVDLKEKVQSSIPYDQIDQMISVKPETTPWVITGIVLAGGTLIIVSFLFHLESSFFALFGLSFV